MFSRLLLVGIFLCVPLAFLLSVDKGASPRHPPYVQGRNRTVLFFANREAGLSNVHSATASGLIESFADIQVHYASFWGVASKIQKASAQARAKNPASGEIVFHELKGKSYSDALSIAGKTLEGVIHPPAGGGIAHLSSDVQLWISPWTVDDHLELYRETTALIDEVDPAVVVLDTTFRPALDATRDKNRQHAFISPNTLLDTFPAEQPYASMFWRYPAMGSGFSFPVPWKNRLENIYLQVRYIYAIVRATALSTRRTVLRQNGLKDPLSPWSLYRNDVPWISTNTKGASVPVQYVPPNVTCAGPIITSGASATLQDSELAAWLKNAPTILVNLGSVVNYTEARTLSMVAAFATVLETKDFQILWKFRKDGNFSDELFAPIQPFIDSGRVRLSKWLSVDPVSLLETGDIVASVHHGGSGCYHEAVAAGVPHVILPLWLDLYNFAALVEDLEVGVWGCRESSPEWNAKCLSDAMLMVVGNEKQSINIRRNAHKLGNKVKALGDGRQMAARIIANLACVGCSKLDTEEDTCKSIIDDL